MRHPLFSFVAASAALALSVIAAHAQCPGHWLPGPELPGPQGSFPAMAILPDGDVVLGGDGIRAPGLPTANNIVRYRPATATWSALGTGVDGAVFALAVDPGGELIVGGRFALAGGAPAANIARYRPASNTWAPVGGAGITFPGSPGTAAVGAIAILPGGDLVVAGSFSRAGAIAASSIARYNPTTQAWSPLGTGVDFLGGGISGIAVIDGGDIIAGGYFGVSTAGGGVALHLARFSFSTSTWSGLGTNLGGGDIIYTVATLPGGDVMVGGAFFAPPAGSPRIGRYRPSMNRWLYIGAGASNNVDALRVLPGGDILVGGYFTSVSGVQASGIVRYRPVSNRWSALPGGGVNDFGVNAMGLLPGGDLFIAGSFTGAGGVVSAGIARYATPGWCPADLDCSGVIGVQDLFVYLHAYLTQTAPGDFNGVSGYTVQDVFDYLAAYFTPCP